MAARSVLIAQAVTDSLNGGSFSQSFTAARRWQRYLAVEQLSTDEPEVSVFPRDIVTWRAESARGVKQWRFGITVSIQQKLQPVDETSVLDGLAELLEEVCEHLEPCEQSGAVSPSGADYVDSVHEFDRIFDEDDLIAGLATTAVTFVFADER